ncbi:MAG TPA: BON domain-containing protein [Planctomycetota bacterium]|nr:BON domain-containing protein [Planctomycetota bacterium]
MLMVKKNFGMTALLAGALCLGSFAADDAPAQEGTPVAPKPADRDAERDTGLAGKINEDFRNDPLFKNMRMTVDLYNGLAIVHGAAPTEGSIAVVNEKLKGREGVTAVYNYMATADRAALPGSFDVRYDDFRRLDRVGMRNSAAAIAQRVQDRLAADSRLDGSEITVDTYNGLVILHGHVADEAIAKRAKDIAAYTEGVDAVLSYIDVASHPEMAPVTAAPILVRSAVVHTIPASFETRISVDDDCGCD